MTIGRRDFLQEIELILSDSNGDKMCLFGHDYLILWDIVGHFRLKKRDKRPFCAVLPVFRVSGVKRPCVTGSGLFDFPELVLN